MPPAGDGPVVLRCSLGRHREEQTLQRTDEELVEVALADLTDAIGLSVRPVDTHVQRWGGALPQYAVGHLDRVATIREGWATVRAGGLRLGVRRRRDPGLHRLCRPGRCEGRRGPCHNGAMTQERPRTSAEKARELNDTIRYTMWSVFRLRDVLGEDADRDAEAREVEELVAKLEADDVIVRGCTTSAGCAPTPT